MNDEAMMQRIMQRYKRFQERERGDKTTTLRFQVHEGAGYEIPTCEPEEAFADELWVTTVTGEDK